MANEALENLMVRLMGDGSSYQRMIHQAQESTSRLADQIQFHSRRIQGFGLTLRGFGQTALGTAAGYAGVLGIGASINAVEGAVTRFMDQEKTEIAFTALIGNAELAQKTLGDLRKFAAETPFESPEIMAAAKQMIAFGESAENILPTMKALGDVSAGLNIPLGQLTYLFGTLKAQGRAMTVDINQFAMRGIPIWAELEKITGKNNAEVRKMVEAGQVGFPMVEQAFKNMTGEGGRFHGQLQKQSQSMSGLVSTLKDNVGMMLSDVGRKFVETFQIKQVIRDLGDAAQEAGRWINFGFDKAVDLGNAVREWVGTTGVEWLRDLVAVAKDFVATNPKLVLGIGLAAGAVGAAVVAFKALNVAMSLALGVAGLLHLDQLAGIALWGVYTGAVLAAKLVLWAFTAAQSLATVSSLGLSGALAVLNVNVLALGVGLTAAAAALGAIAVVGVNVASALYGAYQAGSGFLDVLMELPTSKGPIKAVGDIFSEWQDTLGRIVEIAKTDLPAAWDLSKQAFALGVSQVKDLLPPLWEFVSKGWEVVWKKMKDDFVQGFKDARREILIANDELQGKIADLPGAVWKNLWKSEATLDAEAAGRMADKVEAEVQNILDQTEAGDWKSQIAGLVEQFDRSFKESDLTTSLRAKLKEALDAAEVDAEMNRIMDSVGDGVAQSSKAAVENMPPVSLKVVPKFDAAAFNSVEAQARIAEFRDRLGISPSQPGGRRPANAAKVAGEPAETKSDPEQLDLLRKILEALGGSFGKKLEIAPAEFYDA